MTLFKVRQHSIDTTLLVLDANTGDRIGYYAPSEELGNNPICFSRSAGFTFMGRAKNGNTTLEKALIR